MSVRVVVAVTAVDAEECDYMITYPPSETIAIFFVNWVIHLNRVEPESFSFFLFVGAGGVRTGHGLNVKYVAFSVRKTTNLSSK